MSAIRVENVRKTYPNGFAAVRGVDLTAEDGEFLVLVGPSGCGKTTLLRMIAGLERVSSGRIVIGDEDEPCVDAAVFLKRRIPSAGLLVLPQSGHAVNLEEPALFNAAVLDFFRLVEAGLWPRRARVTTSMLPTASAAPDANK